MNKLTPEKAKRILENMGGQVLSAPTRAYYGFKGKFIADKQRGNKLYNQGYGNYHDSALKIAKEGKSAGKKRIKNTSVYIK